jgi:hypothetical protein
VDLEAMSDRVAIAGLNNPELWTARKVENHENMTKSTDELVADWDAANPSDPVED